MVEARKNGEGGWRREKRGEILFSSKCVCWRGRWQEEDRNKNSHYFLSSLLPSLPMLHSNAKERCQGAGFSVLFCLASSGLGSLAWPPTLLGSGFRKKGARVGGKLWERKQRERGRPPS